MSREYDTKGLLLGVIFLFGTCCGISSLFSAERGVFDVRKIVNTARTAAFGLLACNDGEGGKRELCSVNESLALQKEMIRKYCLLVKEHSLKKYSHLIGRVITLISYDLAADLSLKHISFLMNVNASYLSSAFKKECGETLTEYVNRKRMEADTFILSRSGKQIQAVAKECGILDANYFIKLFKRQYGVTPTQYREEHCF